MKNLLRTIAFLSIFLCSFNLSAQTAQNISFTDLDGVTHDLYSYLDSGYIVILDFSFQYCGPCYDWSVNVGHDLWETYGPDGENILRMFFFDVYPWSMAPDDTVAAYTEEWGIECPVINNDDDNFFPEYPEDGYPTLYFICSDKSFVESGGYGYPFSEVGSFLNLYQQCLGADLDSNFTLFYATEPSQSSLCSSSPLTYEPELRIMESNLILGDGVPMGSYVPYELSIFINNQLYETQTSSANFGFMGYLTDELAPIPVDLGDTLTFVCNFEGDNFALDDSMTVVIPSQLNTPSSSDSSLYLEAESSYLYYSLYGADGQLMIESSSGSAQFELSPDSCYSLSFSNSHVYGMVLKDANEQEVFSFESGQYEGYSTPKLYFHVSNNTVDIEGQNFLDKKILEHYFIDMLGKRHKLNELKYLPKGMYIEVKHFEDGSVSSNKVFKDKP